MYCPPAPLWPMATALSAAISMSPLATAAPDPGDLTGGGVVQPIEPMAWRSFSLGSNIADFYVDDSSESIQDAIDDAEDWDIIVLGSDTWNETLNFQGKAIWLIGNGRVRLNGQYSNIAIQQAGTADESAHLRLTNIRFSGAGAASSEQCLKVDYTKLEVQYCTFIDWELDQWTTRKNGAAIEADDSDVTIENCRFDTCVADEGGAVHGYRSDLTMDSVTFVGCAALSGGGAAVRLGAVKATRCTFQLCQATQGGGIFLIGSNPHTISACRFDRNRAVTDAGTGSGAGIHHRTPGGYHLNIDDCVFTNNTADAAAAIRAVNFSAHRCVFTSNETLGLGWDITGSAYVFGITQSRFCGNTSATPIIDEYGQSLIYSGDDVANVSDCWMGPSLNCVDCTSDLQLDGTVGVAELLFLLTDWGQPSALQDMDGDLQISTDDLIALLADWGSCNPTYVFDEGLNPPHGPR
jgi:hypothetical protein